MDKRLIFPQNIDGRRDTYFVKEDRNFLRKHASAYHPEIASYIEKATPIKDLVQVLLTALGAYESWGQNVNGDRFKIPALTHEGDDYGYKTFLTNANYFLHHVNSNPALAKGKVLKAVWNDKAKRVELVVGIDVNLDPEGVAAIDRGDDVCYSMGCFPAGTPIRMSDGTLKNIENVSVDDFVINHKGAKDRVVETLVRPYKGDLLQVSCLGEGTFTTTPEHPLLAVTIPSPRSKKTSGHFRAVRTSLLEKNPPEWIGARHLKSGDYLAIPFSNEVLTPEWLTKPLMRLFGYYLAEGHVVRDHKNEIAGISFATHKDDPIHKEISGIAEELFSKNPPVTYLTDAARSEFATTVMLFDERLAKLCYLHCGSYARGKRLSGDLMVTDPALQQELLGAYINGDGWQCKDPTHLDIVMISTCNETLTYQVQQIAARNGWISTANKIKHAKGKGFNRYETEEYQIRFAITATNPLSRVSAKIKPTQRLGCRMGRKRIVDQYLLIPIKEIKTLKDAECDVFNFEIAEQHSYLVDSVAVHNCKVPYDVCSICANKAKTRADYCDHLRYMMNQIDPMSGQLVGADNTYPKFFDISRVLIPADKTAHTWAKIASAANPYRSLGSAQLAELPSGLIADVKYLSKVAEEQKEAGREKLGRATKTAVAVKNATITKRIEMKMSPQMSETIENIPTAKHELQERSPSLTAHELAKILASRADIGEILSTYAALAMEPKHDEMGFFAKHLVKSPEDARKVTLSPDRFNPAVAAELLPHLHERSFFRPILMKRIVMLAGSPHEKTADSINELIKNPIRQPKKEPVHPAYVAGVVAALYAIFGPNASGVAKHIGRIASDYPLAFIPLAVGAISGGKGLVDGSTRTTGFYNVDPNLDGLYNKNWQSRFAALQARPVTVIKTGAEAGTTLAKKVFYGVPAIFLASKAAKLKAESQPEQSSGLISKFVQNNPDIIAGGLIGEHITGKPISNKIKSLVSASSRVVKKASIQDIKFLESAPESDKDLLWDIAILDAVNRIHRKL